MYLKDLYKIFIRNLSQIDLNTSKTYIAQRQIENVIYKNRRQPNHRIWDHEIISDNHCIPIRIFHPELEGNFPIMIFFHGGGWVLGNIDTYDRVCDNLANNLLHTVISVEYRLAPEYRFPHGLMDCYNVTKEIFNRINELNISSNNITLIGDSAGANFASVISLMARDTGDFQPKKQILLYPVTYNDHSDNSIFESVKTNGYDYFLTSKRIRDYIELYINSKEDLSNPYLAPILSEDLSNQPDTLILTAEFDPLRDEGEAYGEKLIQFNNKATIFRIPDTMHGFISKPFLNPNVNLAYEKMKDFLSQEY